MRTTAPGQSALLLLDAVEVLTREGISYAVIGAMAASIHGIVRASADADVVLSLGPGKARDVQRVLQAAGPVAHRIWLTPPTQSLLRTLLMLS